MNSRFLAAGWNDGNKSDAKFYLLADVNWSDSRDNIAIAINSKQVTIPNLGKSPISAIGAEDKE